MQPSQWVRVKGGRRGGRGSCSESESYWFTQSRCSLTSLGLLIMKRGLSLAEADEARRCLPSCALADAVWCQVSSSQYRLLTSVLTPVYVVRVQAMHSYMFVQPPHVCSTTIYWKHTFFLYLRFHFHFFYLALEDSFLWNQDYRRDFQRAGYLVINFF